MAKAIHCLLPLLFLLLFEVSAWPTDYSSQEEYPADDAIGDEPSSKDIQQTLEHLARSGNMRNSANWLRGPPPKPSTFEGNQEEENGQVDLGEHEDGHGNNIEEEDEDKGDEDKHEEDEYEDGDGEDEADNEEGDERVDEKHEGKEEMPHEPDVHEQRPDALGGPFGLGPNAQIPNGPGNPNGIFQPEEPNNPAGGMPSLPSGLSNPKARKRGNRVKRQTGGIEGPEGPPDKEYPDGQQEGPNGHGNGEGEGEYPENEMEEENDNIPTTTGSPTTQPGGNGGQAQDDDDPREEMEEGGNVTGNGNLDAGNGTTSMPINGENIANGSEANTQSLLLSTSATPTNTTSSIPSATEDENLGEDENEDEADQGEAETNVITTTPPVGPENPKVGENQQEANDEVGNTGTTSLPIGNVTENVPDGEELGENKEESVKSQASMPPVDAAGMATSTSASQNQTVSQEDLGDDYQDDSEEATTQLPVPPTSTPEQLGTSTIGPEEVGEDQAEDISNEGTTIKASTLLPGDEEVGKDEVKNESNEASSTVQPSTTSVNSFGSELQESANTQLPMPPTNSTASPEELGDDVPDVDSEETSTQLPSPPTESPPGVPESGELGGGEQKGIGNQTLTTLPLNETSTNAGPMGDEDLGEDEEESGESQANTPPFDATESPLLATSTPVATQTAAQEELGDDYYEESREATTQLPAPANGTTDRETNTPAGPEEVGENEEEIVEHNATATVTQMPPPPTGYPFTGIPLATSTPIPAGADELGEDYPEEDNSENALINSSTTQSSFIINGTTATYSGPEGLSDDAAGGGNASQETSTSTRNLTSSQPVNPLETTISRVEDAQQSSTQLPSPPIAATEVTGGNITPSSIGTPNGISAEQIGGDELESDEIGESTHLPNEGLTTQIPTISSTPLSSDANEEVGEYQEDEGDSGEKKASNGTQMSSPQIETTTPSDVEEVGEDEEDEGNGDGMNPSPSTQIPPPPSEASGGVTPSGDEQVLNATSPKPTNGGIDEVGEDQEDSGEKKASKGTQMSSPQIGTSTPSGVEEIGEDEEDEGIGDGMNPSTQIPPPPSEASGGITPSGDEQVLNATSPKPTNGGIDEVGEDEEDGDEFELGGKPSTGNVTENPLIGLSTPVNGSIGVTPMPTGPQVLHPEGNGEAGPNEEENDGPKGENEEEQGEGSGPGKNDANPQKPPAEEPDGEGGGGRKPGQEDEQSGEKPTDNGQPQPNQPPQKEAGTTGQTQENSNENEGQQGQGGQEPESGAQPETGPQQPAGPEPIMPGQDGGQPSVPLPGGQRPLPSPGQVGPGGPLPGTADGSWPGGPGGLQPVGPPINPNGQGPNIPAGGQGPETQPVLPNDQEGPESEGSEEDATTMLPGMLSTPAAEDVEPSSAPVTASPDLTSPAPLSPLLVGTSPPNSNNNNATILDCTNDKGRWGDWHETGPCTADCGACGLVQRTRECLSFREGRGCPCHGDYKVTEPCNIGVCQYPQPSCCMPYNLIYVEGKFACGPHENKEIVKHFLEESNGNKTVGAQRMGLRDRVNRRLFFRRRRK